MNGCRWLALSGFAMLPFAGCSGGNHAAVVLPTPSSVTAQSTNSPTPIPSGTATGPVGGDPNADDRDRTAQQARIKAIAAAARSRFERRDPVVPGDCNAAADSVPDTAQQHCDAEAGWRIFEWVGVSGDGIIRIEQHRSRGWIEAFFGPLCPNGVAAATPRQLAELGVPLALAEAWGRPPSACYP